MHSTTLLQWSIKIYQLEKPNNLTDFSGGCKSKVNQTFDWLASKQPQTSHLVATVKIEQLFSCSDMLEN